MKVISWNLLRLIGAAVASVITNLPDVGLSVRNAATAGAGELASQPAGGIV